MEPRIVLFNMTPAELEQFVAALGAEKFRAKQISEWLSRGASDFSDMKNLPRELQEKLNLAATALPLSIVQKLESSDGATTKFLLKLDDGGVIETVLMRTSYGNSVCVSSQAGCAMGCRFCASTLLGLKRNLTANEMIAQVLIADWELKKSAERKMESRDIDVSHIVVMGTGEPLHNTKNLFEFLEYANKNMEIGWRKITVSTCGIIPGILEMIEWGHPVNLAISLHAPTDELRSKLMPINDKYNLESVLRAAFEYTTKTGRQLMIEYILLSGVNDTVESAEQLSEILKDKLCMVNLIPWNTVDERDFFVPSGNAVHRFQDILIKNGIHTRIRRERGEDIGSACGQLRLSSKE